MTLDDPGVGTVWRHFVYNIVGIIDTSTYLVLHKSTWITILGLKSITFVGDACCFVYEGIFN